jgi:UDP-glucose 4-epimerase
MTTTHHRVLVTGGSGWIGRATCGYLASLGYEPVPYDRTSGHDILDRAELVAATADVDHVIHLAGVLGTHELFMNPDEAVSVNVAGSLNVVLACLEHDLALTEITMPRVNPSLYAATKACAMDIALAYVDAGMLRASFVRAFNAYGPGQAYGGDHPQKIVPTFASKAWAGEPLPVWGDGRLLTDLVHVDDVARCLVAGMGAPVGAVIDAGTGFGLPVLEVARMVMDIVEEHGGPAGTVRLLPPRAGERRESTSADLASADGWRYLDGWRPQFERDRFTEAVLSYRP